VGPVAVDIRPWAAPGEAGYAPGAVVAFCVASRSSASALCQLLPLPQ
jgi:hypothetical protein